MTDYSRSDAEGERMSSISLPCIIKQPGKQDLSGVIRKDLGDRVTKKSKYIPKR